MTPLELRKAAEFVQRADEESDQRKLTKSVHLVTSYILATVREDDDEKVTYEWICSTKTPYIKKQKIWWNFDR